MRGPRDFVGEYEEDELPIVHPDRTIGDSVELVPGRLVGDHGPVKEILRTKGGDARAQLLTITVVGSGIYESDLRGASSAPRGPLVGLVEWGVGGAKAKAEFDIPVGGVSFSVVASYVQVAARYDGMLAVNGVQLDPEAFGGTNPGPRQRVGAMVGYGSYGASAKLTRTVRIDSVRSPDIEGSPNISQRVRVPPFARRLLLTGLNLDRNAYRLLLGSHLPQRSGDLLFGPGQPSRSIDLPGDTTFIQVLNLASVVLENPALIFELAM